MKTQQKIFGIESLLSKTIDSLCLELSITHTDQNSIGLIEIITWQINNQISKQQFHELYNGWIQAKGIQNIFKTKQISMFNKAELYLNDKIPKQFFNVFKINLGLELINQQYNMQYMNRYNNLALLQAFQKIFSYLDVEGIIHLRIPQIFFLYLSLISSQIVFLKQKSVKCFDLSFHQFLKQINSVAGKLSLRNFKNYMITKCNQTNVHKIFHFFTQIQKAIGCSQYLPDLFEESFMKWKNSSHRFESDKRKPEIYKRIFEQYQHLFYEYQLNSNHILSQIEDRQSSSFFKIYNIDTAMIEQFLANVKKVQEKYIKLFFNLYDIQKDQKPINKSHVDQNKSHNRTPLKNQKATNIHDTSIQNLSKTLTPIKEGKKYNNKSQTIKTISPMNPKHQNDKSDIWSNLNYFKNKKIQSFDLVMKRLRQK